MIDKSVLRIKVL